MKQLKDYAFIDEKYLKQIHDGAGQGWEKDKEGQKMKKMGQLGIFMVIGVVLFLIAAFSLYVQKYALERQSELVMMESQIFEGDIDALQGYLQSVAEDSTEKALIAWSNASGIKDASQSGLSFEECNINGRKQNLTYLYKD